MKRRLSLKHLVLMFFLASSAFTATAADLSLPDTFPGGFSRTKAVEFYNKGNLFELINGQAIFYLSYGFEKLSHAFYQKGSQTYKVDVYQVQDELSAMGCFREQKDEEASTLAVGTEGYLMEYLAAFYKGIYYLEIVPTGDGKADDLKSLATQLAGIIPGKTSLPREMGVFPKQGIVAGSETYFGESLLSYSFMGRGLSANYTQTGSDKELRVFFAIAAAPDSARNIQKEFNSKLTNAGSLTITGASAGIRGELPYRGESWLFTWDRYAIGAIGVANKEQATAILQQLLTNIKGLK
jgi:hypothetical protein